MKHPKRLLAGLIAMLMLVALFPAAAGALEPTKKSPETFAISERNAIDTRAQAPTKNPQGTLGIEQSSSGYDVRGYTTASVPIKTTFANGGYSTYIRYGGSNSNISLSKNGDAFTGSHSGTGLGVSLGYDFINGGNYLRLTYTLKNNSEAEITGVDLGVCADVQIGNDDSASIYPTDTGFRMVNTYNDTSDPGFEKQFTLVCKNAVGVQDVSTMWFGYYGERVSNLYATTTAPELTGRDSGLAFSWQGIAVPAKYTVTRAVLFGVNANAAPPATTPMRLYLETAGEADILVNAEIKDTAGLTDTLYYTINGGDEQILGSVVAAGENTKTITGVIPATSFTLDGEYTLLLWIMNSKGAMSQVVTKTLTIQTGSDGKPSVTVTNANGQSEALPVGTVEGGAVLPLNAPTNLAWAQETSTEGETSTTATWEAVSGADYYYLLIYEGQGNTSTPIGAPILVNAPAVDGKVVYGCTEKLGGLGDGNYTFAVMAATEHTSSTAANSDVLAYTAPPSPGGTLSGITQAELDAVFGPGVASPDGTTVVLNRPITLENPIELGADMNLNLNGHDIRGPEGQSAITIGAEGVALTVSNTAGTTGVIHGGDGIGDGGDGGAAINMGDHPGSVTIGSNVTVQGGDGANNATGNGGSGGAGIAGSETAGGQSVTLQGTSSSGQGGSGGSATASGNGGSGGDGVSLNNGSAVIGGSVTGGDGGSGGSGGSGTDDVGGAGGTGASMGGGSANISGSANGGNGGTGTTGGAGGSGASMNGEGSSVSGNANGGDGGTGTTGGAGGSGVIMGGSTGNVSGNANGGDGGTGSAGGNGGNGASLVGGNTNVSGSASGGDGGTGTVTAGGNGGSGVSLESGTVSGSGSAQGGNGGNIEAANGNGGQAGTGVAGTGATDTTLNATNGQGGALVVPGGNVSGITVVTDPITGDAVISDLVLGNAADYTFDADGDLISITLNSDVVVTAPLELDQNVTLNLNGHSITGAPGGSAITITGDAAVTITGADTNTGTGTGTISGGAGNPDGNGGAGINTGSSGSLTIGADVHVTGGAGGNASGYSDGGNGASGITGGGTLEVNGSVTGGAGGNATGGGDGGDGGTGIAYTGEIAGTGSVTGGNGGNSAGGSSGSAGSGISAGGTFPSGTVTNGQGGTSQARYAVTIMANGDRIDHGMYSERDTVTITAPYITGYRFANWVPDRVTLADPYAGTTTFTMPGHGVTITANYTEVVDDGGSYTPPPPPQKASVAYNSDIPAGATIWLSSSELEQGDRLITQVLEQGAVYKEMLAEAQGFEVFRVYDISLLSGKTALSGGMLTFDLNEKYAGQEYTLVHQKADGTMEIFLATADEKGDLTFSPIYELSPFMLVKGTLEDPWFLSIPKTGGAPNAGWAYIALAVLSVAGLALWKKAKGKIDPA